MDRMCDCFDANQMQRPQLDHWHLWCHIVTNSMRLTRPMMNHYPNGQPGCHLLHPNSCQRANPAYKLMDAPALTNFGQHLSQMCSIHLYSHLFHYRYRFWHNLCYRFHRTIWCRRLLCWHRTVNLVMNGNDLNDDLRMGSCQAIMESLCMLRWLHFDHDVQPMTYSCQMFGADDHRIRFVQNMNSCWR